MLTYITYIVVKYLVISLLLWLVYRFMLRGRASHNGERLFLILLPVVALAVSTVSFYPIVIQISSNHSVGRAMATISEVSHYTEEEPTSPATLSQISDEVLTTTPTAPITNIDTPTQAVAVVKATKPTSTHLSFDWIVAIVECCVSLYLLASYAVGLYKISRLRKCSYRELSNGINIYKSPIIEGPFSAFRSIFINNSLCGEKLDVVIMHEMAHIYHRHYIDKLIVELYTILLWFNPIVWFIRRDLTLIHEFQADGEVINAGLDVVQYKYFLYDQTVGGTPAISNGFNNSLIKQRFLQMKKDYQIKSSLPTKVAVLLSVALLFVVASCTFTDAKRVQPQFTNLSQEIADGQITIFLKDGNQRKGVAIEMAPWIIENSSLVDSISIEKAPTNRKELGRCILEEEQFNIIDRKDYANVTIYRRDGYTEVDEMHQIYANWYWTYFTSSSYLLDRKSGDRYPVLGIAGGMPLNQKLIIRRHMGKYAMHTLIFPPIKEGVEYLDLVSGDLPDSLSRPSNTMSKDYIADIKVQGDIERPYRDARNGAKIEVDIKGIKF